MIYRKPLPAPRRIVPFFCFEKSSQRYRTFGVHSFLLASVALSLAASKAQAEPTPLSHPAAVRTPFTSAIAAAVSSSSTTGNGSYAEARRLSDAFATVAEKVGPSVVQIEVLVRDPSSLPLRWFRGGSDEAALQRGLGSGVIVSQDGAVITNNHVIEQALAMNVRLNDGRILTAKLVGRDPATDLAVLKVDAKNLPFAHLADDESTKVGEWVVAIGSPFGLGHTVTTGVVSAKGRGSLGANAIEDYLQTDASINPGNSGGPLVNLEGQVIAINTMIVGHGAGIGFAVPSTMARRVAEQLLTKGHVERAWIGIGVQDVTPALAQELNVQSGMGALINAVMPNGPGAQGNLKSGDVVTSVNGKPLQGAQEFIRELFRYDVGHTVSLEVLRAGRRYGATVTLSARVEPTPPVIPAQMEAPKSPGLGITLRDTSAQAAASMGLSAVPMCQVTRVTPGSAADRAGLHPGDMIMEVNGQPEPNAATVQRIAMGGHMLVRIRRREGMFYTALQQ